MLKRRKPIKRTPRVTQRKKPRRGPERSPEYLAWIRTLACVVCHKRTGTSTRVEAAHTIALGPWGFGRKSSDFSAIPLCFWHHRGDSNSYHVLGERQFAETHHLNIQESVAALNESYWRCGPGLDLTLVGWESQI